MENESLVHIGKIIKTRGFRGEVRVRLLTDFPERFRNLSRFYLVRESIPSEILEARIHSVKYISRDFVAIRFEGVDSVEKARDFVGFIIAVPREEIPPIDDEGSYYVFDLVGLDVLTDGGIPLGRISDVFPTGSNDVCVVRGNGGEELLLPMIPNVVLKIDLEGRKMIVHTMEGLL
ncbi:MAG: ribosome maturation factor RimM [bacterium]